MRSATLERLASKWRWNTRIAICGFWSGIMDAGSIRKCCDQDATGTGACPASASGRKELERKSRFGAAPRGEQKLNFPYRRILRFFTTLPPADRGGSADRIRTAPSRTIRSKEVADRNEPLHSKGSVYSKLLDLNFFSRSFLRRSPRVLHTTSNGVSAGPP